MLFIKPFKYESRISWSCMKNKAKLGTDQNCWQLHQPTGRTCLRTSATRTAQLQMILYLQSLPSGVLPTYDEGSTMCKQAWDNKTKCWIQLLMKTLNACIVFKSRDTSESKKQLGTKASQPPASSAEPVLRLSPPSNKHRKSKELSCHHMVLWEDSLFAFSFLVVCPCPVSTGRIFRKMISCALKRWNGQLKASRRWRAWDWSALTPFDFCTACTSQLLTSCPWQINSSSFEMGDTRVSGDFWEWNAWSIWDILRRYNFQKFCGRLLLNQSFFAKNKNKITLLAPIYF